MTRPRFVQRRFGQNPYHAVSLAWRPPDHAEFQHAIAVGGVLAVVTPLDRAVANSAFRLTRKVVLLDVLCARGQALRPLEHGLPLFRNHAVEERVRTIYGLRSVNLRDARNSEQLLAMRGKLALEGLDIPYHRSEAGNALGFEQLASPLAQFDAEPLAVLLQVFVGLSQYPALDFEQCLSLRPRGFRACQPTAQKRHFGFKVLRAHRNRRVHANAQPRILL